jgi:hypothetical protein
VTDEKVEPFWDYADQVRVTIKALPSMWEQGCQPEVVWLLEFPGNTGGPAGPPIDTRLLATPLRDLPRELDGNACCGGRAFVLQTQHSQVEIGPSGASTHLLLELASHAGDASLDLILGAAGLKAMRRIRQLLEGRNEGGPNIAASLWEARERARALLESHYETSDLTCILESESIASEDWGFEFKSADGTRFGAQVTAIDGHLIAVVKVWVIRNDDPSSGS